MNPLLLDVTPKARQEFNDLSIWLSGISEDNARRFTLAFYEEMATLCQETAEQIANGGRPAGLLDESGSLAFAQPVRVRLFTTQKKRVRRSASGTYKAFYTLLDLDQDGKVDTLRILSVCHAAARPVWDMDSSDQ